MATSGSLRTRIDELARAFVEGSSFGEDALISRGEALAEEMGFAGFAVTAVQQDGGPIIACLAGSLEMEGVEWGVQITGGGNRPPHEQLLSSPRVMVSLGTMDNTPLPLSAEELDRRIAQREVEASPSIIAMGNYHIEADREKLDDLVIVALSAVIQR